MMKLILVLIAMSAGPTFAGTPAPNCLGSQGQSLPEMDAQVILWKTTTPNQFLARAHIVGAISDIYPDHNGHTHFAVIFNARPQDNLEIVYNQSFGMLPHLAVGMTVEACGDYITSDAPTTQYPASPAGAILHWIHRNPKGAGHPSGYLMINGSVYGQGSGSGQG